VVVVVDIGGGGVTTLSSVVVVVVLTGVGPQPANTAAPAISAMPIAVRRRGVLSIIV
jgi:hypothetical protein